MTFISEMAELSLRLLLCVPCPKSRGILAKFQWHGCYFRPTRWKFGCNIATCTRLIRMALYHLFMPHVVYSCLLDENKKEESKEGSAAIGPVTFIVPLPLVSVPLLVLISDCRSQPTTEPAKL
jgi:hypothetical protein